MKRLGLGLSLVVLLAAPPASAQRRPVVRPPRSVPRLVPIKTKKSRPRKTGQITSLEGRLGLAVATRLLASKDAEDKERGLSRLGKVATPAALELLTKAVEAGGAANTPEQRLVAVRALAPHAKKREVRLALVRAMGGGGSSPGDQRSDPFVTLARGTAALALARAGDTGALALLGQALRQEGPIAAAAADALLAHPPRDLGPILNARGAPTRALARLLGELGDQRAFTALRTFVRRGAPEVRVAAAIALTQLGDLETVALAHHWLKNEKDPALRIGATRILALTRAPGAGPAIAKLIEDESTRAVGLQLALSAPAPALAAAVSQHVKEDDVRWLGALGRADAAKAAGIGAALLSDPAHRTAAAWVLGTTPGDAAEDALEKALVAPSTRRLAARAAVVRSVALGDRSAHLQAALESLLGSASEADRSAAAWGLSRLDPARGSELLRSKDGAVVRGAARNAFDPAMASAAARRLATEADPLTRTALGSALAVPAARSHVPTRVLMELIDGGGAAAPIAAAALAARDDASLRPKLVLLLASQDPLLRSHVALGLGDSRDASALGVLEARYLREPDARVRRAIVGALSRRSEPVRRRALTLAAELDPDRDTRQAARIALNGHRLAPLARGTASMWLELSRSGGGDPGPVALRVVTVTGLALPAVSDPDGLLVVSGLPPGPMELSLAADANPDHPR